MTEKQLFYPLLSVYFSLILGDLQKEKLQIVSIFRFGHKKRGLFQCPPKGGHGEGLLGLWLGLSLLPPRPLNHLTDMLGEMSVGR